VAECYKRGFNFSDSFIQNVRRNALLSTLDFILPPIHPKRFSLLLLLIFLPLPYYCDPHIHPLPVPTFPFFIFIQLIILSLFSFFYSGFSLDIDTEHHLLHIFLNYAFPTA